MNAPDEKGRNCILLENQVFLGPSRWLGVSSAQNPADSLFHEMLESPSILTDLTKFENLK
jgi:hypothetical protein